MAPNRDDGFDFSDGRQSQFEEHPDLAINAGGLEPAHLQRNKTERRRLQGLQRSNTVASRPVQPYEPKTLVEKWQHWMINEGGKRLFFFVWIFLHILVVVLGTLHYGLKDNLTTARATFGVTFSAFLPPSLVMSQSSLNNNHVHRSHRPFGCTRSTCRCRLHPSSRLPQLYLTSPPHTPQPCYSIRQKYHFSQGHGMVYRLLHGRAHRGSHGQFH